MNTNNIINIAKTAFISIISVLLFFSFITIILFLYVSVFNPEIKINNTIIRSKSLYSSTELKNIKDFNDKQWIDYFSSWQNTVNKLSSVKDCLIKMEQTKQDLEEKHKEYDRSRMNNTLTDEQRFYEGVYKSLDSLISSISQYEYYWTNKEPYFIPIFINESDPNSTKEQALSRLQEAKAEFSNMDQYAVTFKCPLLEEISYKNKSFVCNNLINASYELKNFSDPIIKEPDRETWLYDQEVKNRDELYKYNISVCEEYGTNYIDFH